MLAFSAVSKTLTRLILCAAFLASAPLAAHAEPDAGETARAWPFLMQSGEQARLSGESDDMAFAAGGEVRADAEIADDLFAAGGEVTIDGARADHLIAAGGRVELRPAEAHDVIAAGGRVSLDSGTIADDIVLVGGDVSARAEVEIGGSALVAGGRVRIEAPITDKLVASGGAIELNAAIGGDARLSGERIVIGPNARVGGDLHLRGTDIEISPQAMIAGETIREDLPRRHGETEAKAAIATLGVLLALGVLALHGVIAIALPGTMRRAQQRLFGAFWASAGIGALIVLLGPAALAALFFSVIGAPLALFLVFVYLSVAVMAFAAIAFWIGQMLRNRFNAAKAGEPPKWGARLGWTMLGALVLMLVCAIPLIGGLAWLLALIAGLGALVGQALQARAEL